jgi:NADPH:quinone reductase-like Zn-dependent oxidoreductase
MKALQIREFGLSHLEEAERPDPTPGPREVLLRMRAASINYRDILMIGGLYNPKQKLPLVPLSDGVGEVIAAGAEVKRVAVGDRVMPSFFQGWTAGPVPRDLEALRGTLGGPLDGVLRTRMCLDEQGVVKVPSHLTDAEAACLPCAGLTAWNAIVVQSELAPGDTVVLQGTGGVSIFALQFAKMIGCRTIITSSSDEKLARAKSLGADETINYVTTPEWSKEVRRLTDGRGASHVVDVGGAGTLNQSMRAVHPGGCVNVIGVLAGNQGELNMIPVLMQNLRLQGVFVGNRDELERMCRGMAQHHLHPVVDRVFPFSEARTALDYASQGKHFGKVCIDLT